MRPVVPVLALVLAQVAQPNPSRSYEWCFERGKDRQLCKETEAACLEQRRANVETATSGCKRIEPPEIQESPTEPPAPPNPARQTPTQR